MSAAADARPFFGTEVSGKVFRMFQSVLPFATAGGASRPTILPIPIHSGETVTRYLQPITPDGVVFFAETSWPISTVFQLWLEGINGVPNAPSASGPTRSFPPDHAEFLYVADLPQKTKTAAN